MFRGVEPAWNDANLRELAAHVTSPLFFAHIRASSGTAIQRTNCHPFRHGRWLWMHNGLINDFHAVKRDLVLDVDPSLYPSIEGQTDSEVLFYLALTLGLEDDPPAAVAGAVGLVEAAGRRRGVEHPFQGTIATTDGERLWVFRYSSEGRSRSLFLTTDVPTLRALYPRWPCWRAVGRRPARRVRAARRPPGRVARGPRGQLRRHRRRGRRDPAVRPAAQLAPARPAHVAGSWPA